MKPKLLLVLVTISLLLVAALALAPDPAEQAPFVAQRLNEVGEQAALIGTVTRGSHEVQVL